jgi:hypothetical protein
MEKLRSYFAKSQHLRLSETESKVQTSEAISSETANLEKNHSKIHIIDSVVRFQLYSQQYQRRKNIQPLPSSKDH